MVDVLLILPAAVPESLISFFDQFARHLVAPSEIQLSTMRLRGETATGPSEPFTLRFTDTVSKMESAVISLRFEDGCWLLVSNSSKDDASRSKATAEHEKGKEPSPRIFLRSNAISSVETLPSRLMSVRSMLSVFKDPSPRMCLRISAMSNVVTLPSPLASPQWGESRLDCIGV